MTVNWDFKKATRYVRMARPYVRTAQQERTLVAK